VVNKSPEAFRTISEVADTLDVPPHVLRFWETRFTQVKPVKRGGGRRYYRPEDVCLLRGIRGLLYDDGMTIKGVQKILRERGVRHVIGLGTLPQQAEAEATPAAPQPAPAPAPRSAPAPRPVSQDDLFTPASGTAPAAEGELAEIVEELEEPAQPAMAPERRAALKGLVARLEALRVVMAEGPPR
jgi:DNA-binding transcriptional MerR regulator